MKVVSTDVHSTTLSRICPFCKKEHQLTIPTPVLNRGIAMLEDNALVQNAFPTLTPSQREFFVTGICDKCWL